MFAISDAGTMSIAWAALHLEQVSQLILWCSWASRASVSSSPQTKALRALVEQDWDTYVETAARVIMGWSGAPAEAARFAEFYRACTTQEVVLASISSVYEWNVQDLLGNVQCPVLVMQPRDMPTLSPDVARQLAMGIPEARLLILNGRSPVPFLGDVNAALHAITEFLGGSDSASAQVADVASGASVTILFTDMEGSTALTQSLGDSAAQDVVHAHNRIVREALVAHGGTEIKHTGDGLMLAFPSATRAVECAVVIQQQSAAYAEKHPDGSLRVRVGLNAGEPVAEHVITSEHRCSSPRESARWPSPARSWCPVSSATSRPASVSSSPTLARRFLEVSRTRSTSTKCAGSHLLTAGCRIASKAAPHYSWRGLRGIYAALQLHTDVYRRTFQRLDQHYALFRDSGQRPN